jgi:hypothetical protein
MKKALIAALAFATLVPAVSLAQNVPTPAVQTPSGELHYLIKQVCTSRGSAFLRPFPFCGTIIC